MTPAIKKQTKVLINDNNEKNLDFSRLQAHLDIPAVVSSADILTLIYFICAENYSNINILGFLYRMN